MRALVLQRFVEKMVYPAALLGLGLLGNRYTVRGEVKEELKDVKADVKNLGDKYSAMEKIMAGLLNNQKKLEDHYHATVARLFKGCKATEEKK